MRHITNDSYECLTPQKPTHAVVFLHGLGASGHDLLPLAEVLQDQLSGCPVLWQFPHAESRPVTLNGGMVMPAWFDLFDIDRRSKEDVEGIQQASEHIWEQLQAIHQQGIPWQNIVLCGFSQGGALALYTALTAPKQLAGVASFSGYLPRRQSLAGQLSSIHLPIWLIHGEHDPVVPIEFFELSEQTLGNIDAQMLTTHTLPMGHEISSESLQLFLNWLKPILNCVDAKSIS